MQPGRSKWALPCFPVETGIQHTSLSVHLTAAVVCSLPVGVSGFFGFVCFRLPFTFVTKEVADATCECLLAQAEQAEKLGKSKAAAERMILEEFGRCLMRVINSAGKSKSDPCAMNC